MRCVGIDVSQATLDVVLHDGTTPQHWQVANTPAGILALVETLRAAGCAHIVLEPTGPYHVPVATALQQAALPVSAVGPAELHAYRRLVRTRHKTDAADAALLATYAQTQPHALQPMAPRLAEQQQLRALVRYREQLVQQRIRLSQQQMAAAWTGGDEVVAWLAEDIAQVHAREQQVTTEIRTQLTAMPEAAVLLAMPGVGPITVASVLAYLPRALWGDAKKAAAYAGLVPQLHASGKQAYSHLSTRGHRQLRRALYNGAATAARWDADLAACRAAFLAQGKAKKSARCAVAHRLIRHMMGRLRAFSAQQAPLAA